MTFVQATVQSTIAWRVPYPRVAQTSCCEGQNSTEGFTPAANVVCGFIQPSKPCPFHSCLKAGLQGVWLPLHSCHASSLPPCHVSVQTKQYSLFYFIFLNGASYLHWLDKPELALVCTVVIKTLKTLNLSILILRVYKCWNVLVVFQVMWEIIGIWHDAGRRYECHTRSTHQTIACSKRYMVWNLLIILFCE